jgi:hypothetical protein
MTLRRAVPWGDGPEVHSPCRTPAPGPGHIDTSRECLRSGFSHHLREQCREQSLPIL